MERRRGKNRFTVNVLGHQRPHSLGEEEEKEGERQVLLDSLAKLPRVVWLFLVKCPKATGLWLLLPQAQSGEQVSPVTPGTVRLL